MYSKYPPLNKSYLISIKASTLMANLKARPQNEPQLPIV